MVGSDAGFRQGETGQSSEGCRRKPKMTVERSEGLVYRAGVWMIFSGQSRTTDSLKQEVTGES